MAQEQLSISKLIKMNLLTLLLFILAYILDYAANLLLANLLHVKLFGEYSATINILKIFAFISLFGIQYATIKLIPQYINKNDWEHVAGYFRYSLGLVGKIGISVFCFSILTILVLYLFDKYYLYDSKHYHISARFLWIIPAITISIYFRDLLRSFKHIYLALICSDHIVQPFIIICILLFLKFSFFKLNLYQALILYFVSLMGVIILQILFNAFKLPIQLLKTTPKYQKSHWIKLSLSIFISTFLFMYLPAMTIILSRIFDKNVAACGILSATFIITGFIWLVSISTTTLIGPLVGPALQEKKENLQLLLNTGAASIFASSCIFITIIVIFGKQLLGHFGKGFIVGYPELVIISVVFSFAATFGLPLVFLRFSDHHNKLMYLSCISIIIYIILSGFLSANYGLRGTIIALSVIQLTLTFSCCYLAKKLLGIKPFIIF